MRGVEKSAGASFFMNADVIFLVRGFILQQCCMVIKDFWPNRIKKFFFHNVQKRHRSDSLNGHYDVGNRSTCMFGFFFLANMLL